MAEAWGRFFVMRCSMLRLRVAGVSLTGENTGTMNAGGHSCTVHRSVFFPCSEAFRRRPRFRRPPCERKLRSERHGRTTVAGPTRKLWFQDRRWPESCQGGPEKRRLSGGKERFASSLPVPSGFVEVFPLPAEAFFSGRLCGGGKRAFCRSAGEAQGRIVLSKTFTRRNPSRYTGPMKR